METLEITTARREELIDITDRVREAVRATGLSDGAVLVYCPHTTAAITINENADPAVASDLIDGLRDLAPRQGHWRHSEGNSDGPMKSSLVGAGELVPVSDGRPVLGTWQAIWFCEFDGPRHRRVYVQPLSG